MKTCSLRGRAPKRKDKILMEPINEHEKRKLENAPFGQLGLIMASGCRDMGTEIDHYLTLWRAERQNEHLGSPS